MHNTNYFIVKRNTCGTRMLVFCREFRVNVLLPLLLLPLLMLLLSLSFFSMLFSYKNLLRCCCFHSFHIFFLFRSLLLPLVIFLTIRISLFFSSVVFSTQNSSNGFSLDRCIHVTTHTFFTVVRSFIRSECLCRTLFFYLYVLFCITTLFGPT